MSAIHQSSTSDPPGMNHVVFMLYFLNILSNLGVPTSPANIPREISPGESSPP